MNCKNTTLVRYVNTVVFPLWTQQLKNVRLWDCCDGNRKARAACAQSFTLWQRSHAMITQLLLVRATLRGCCSSRTSASWWIAHSTQRQRRGCNKTKNRGSESLSGMSYFAVLNFSRFTPDFVNSVICLSQCFSPWVPRNLTVPPSGVQKGGEREPGHPRQGGNGYPKSEIEKLKFFN